MRLALKIFVAQSLVILVVAAVAYYSISEIASLLPASRATTICTAEALRVEVLLRESMRQASALEQRFVVFGDQEYAGERTRMAKEMADALTALPARLATELERARLRSAVQHFNSADRLLHLVNDILDLSRASAGVLPLEPRLLDLERAAFQAVDELRVGADDAQVKLTCERGLGSLELEGDERRVVQALVNLVANAIRFTPPGGTVTVRLADAGTEVEAHVEDTGVGIPAAELPYIFDRYRQAHGSRGGTGLGLAIVRAIVDAHGGRVGVESREGHGSRFTIALPRRLATPPGPSA